MRRSIIRPVGLCLLAVLAILLVAAHAQEPFDQVLQKNSIDKAIEVIRAINAAEYDYRNAHGRFGSWCAVYVAGWRTLGSLGLRTRGENPVQTWRDLSIADAEVIPGYRLTLLVADDGTAYSVSLHDMGTHGCGPSVFSDQSGLIYQGTIIDCPQIVDVPPVRANRK
jgi:hypothetical protein